MREVLIRHYQEIFPFIAEGYTIICSTELSKRNLAVNYVRETGNPLLASSIISFDEFTNALFKMESPWRKVDSLDLAIFSEYFVQKYAESGKLKYFFRDNGFSELKASFPSFIVEAIKGLRDRDKRNGIGVTIDNLRSDLMLLEDEYLIYLENLELYDQSYLDVDDNFDFSRFCFLYPDSDVNMKTFINKHRIEDKNAVFIKAAIPTKENDIKLGLFKNEREELRSLMLKIRSLVDAGVPLNEIAITSSAVKRVRPYLEFEAKLFDIHLEFVQGEYISDHLFGKYLLSLSKIYNEGYLVSDLKSFFLDPGFDFPDKEKMRSFIHKALNYNVFGSQSRKEDMLLKLQTPDGFDYHYFRSRLDAIMSTKNPESFRRILIEFINRTLGEVPFSGDPVEKSAYGYSRNKLDEFVTRLSNDVLKEKYSLKKPLFSLFLDYINNSSYTRRRDNRRGINVYSLSQGNALIYKNHFVITLNEKESSLSIKEGAFLTEYERAGLNEIKLTNDIINTLLVGSDNLILSASVETYSGAELPVITLLDRKIDEKLDSQKDPYLVEDSKERGMITISPFQRNGFIEAEKISFKPPVNERIGKKKKDNSVLSYTSISLYSECHYKWALEKEYNLAKKETYDLKDSDNLEIGNVIHRVFSQYFLLKNVGKTPDIQKIYNREMEEWMNGRMFNGIDKNGDPLYRELHSGAFIPQKSFIKYIDQIHLHNVIEIAKELDDAVSWKSEKTIEKDIDGVKLKGIIDLEVTGKDGEVTVIDFKTGKPYSKPELEKHKLQFFIYSLLEKLDGKEVMSGKFAFTRKGSKNFKEAYSRKDEDALEAVRDGIKKVDEDIRGGNWSEVEDQNMCSGCEYKAICRKRMVVR